MRNISFALTTDQVLDRSKTVTRRLGWTNLKVGDRLQGCKKCMGRKPGEPLVKLAVIEVVSIRREPLNVITQEDVIREGFKDGTPKWFVDFFCSTHKGCQPQTEVTRIEFAYPIKKPDVLTGREQIEVSPGRWVNASTWPAYDNAKNYNWRA